MWFYNVFYTAESDIEDREARPLLGIVVQCKCTLLYVICWPTELVAAKNESIEK